MGDEELLKRSHAQKAGGGGGSEEDRECDGSSELRDIWKNWEENGEQQQRQNELDTVDRETIERKVRKETTKKKCR